MTRPDPDRFERTIEVRAPRARVWQAISNARDFAAWFGLGAGLELRGELAPGAEIVGVWDVDGRPVEELFFTVEAVEPGRRLAFRWVPYEVPAGEDPRRHPTTRIELTLEDTADGTRLTVVEAGFAALPADKQYKRDQNAQGWAVQVEAIARHVLGGADVHVEHRIARPPADVFAELGDPARLAPALGVAGPVHVHQATPARTSFVWDVGGAPAQVTVTLAADGDATRVTVRATPFALAPARVAAALAHTRGWTAFLCALEARLEHGALLRGAEVGRVP